MTDFHRVQDLLRYFDENEIWRPVVGNEKYSVSSWGRVRGPRRLLSPTIVYGYEKVSLSDETACRCSTVHRLVVLAFLGVNPFDNAIIAHNDGNRRNNRVSNLRWASAIENQRDRVRHHTLVRGSEVEGAKLHESDIPSIRVRVSCGEKYSAIALDYGVSISTIHLIAVNRTWKHVGGAAWA